MPSKITFLAGFASGYVLGSRAGRARYEQIRGAAQSFLANPTVQSTTATLQEQAGEALGTAKDKAASTLSDKISERLGDKKPSWMGSSTESSTAGGTVGTPPSTAAANGGTGNLS